jgi:hypothetical protein
MAYIAPPLIVINIVAGIVIESDKNGIHVKLLFGGPA